LHKGNVPEAEVYIEKGGSAPPARPGYANDSYWRCVWAEEGFGTASDAAR
jgi:hypothetical protein